MDLASVADLVQAAMVGLTGRVETGGLAPIWAGLPLVELLGWSTRLTPTERRGLVRTAAGLERMPALAGAVRAGLVGAGEARIVLGTCRRLPPEARTTIDGLFTDRSRLATQTVDAVLDEIAGRVALIDERRAADDHIKAFERRFLAVQPGLEGTISGYFEIDDQCGAMLLRALEDAAPPITGAKALTRDATLPTEPTPTGQPEPPAPGPDGEHTTATDGPAPPGRPAKRARPLIYVWTDIDTLVGTAATGAAARLLWDTLAPNPVLSPTAVRQLADDARLQFLLVHHGEVLGVAAPVDTIPAKVRAAVHARDQGCRFPGCAVPIHQTDLHHVIGRPNRATPPWPTSSRCVEVTTPLSPTPAGTSP